jgi:hypothetical protein
LHDLWRLAKSYRNCAWYLLQAVKANAPGLDPEAIHDDTLSERSSGTPQVDSGDTFIVPAVVLRANRMRRDYFTVDIRHDDGIPTLEIEYDGPSGELRESLTTPAGTPVEAGDLDVAFRHQRASDGGVLSVTDRLTGEYIFEVEVLVPPIDDLVEAAGSHDGDGEYGLRLTDDETSRTYEKRTLLVYDPDGELLRGRSLIPGGVEL